ncbi:MAG: aminoglycoside phosphotransferase family protein, partial [Lachnospiraceae bacterium]|nr:aminoglycoside phosphotransferase family protein [Lachnospiraceae bacterium]
CAAMGGILGRMHGANISLAGIEPEVEEAEVFPWDTYLQTATERGMQNMQDDQGFNWLAQYEKAVSDIKTWNRTACDAQQTLAQTQVLSHRDLDPKNVMWNGAEPLVIDWEAAGYINPYQEFLEVLNYWADDGEGGLVRSYFDALAKVYRNHMSLAEVPWDAVFAGSFSGMLGWLDYNVKRALGIEASGEEEIRMGEEQVIGTIGALYAYCDKVKQMQEWLGIKNDR